MKTEIRKKTEARVVAGGQRQVYQRDYDTVYAPIVGFTISILTLILKFTLGWFCVSKVGSRRGRQNLELEIKKST